VLDRRTGGTAHLRFHEVVDLFEPRDVLVLNETRVLPARLIGRRPGGGRAEVLLVAPVVGTGAREWRALVRPGSRLRAGARVEIGNELGVQILGTDDDGMRIVRLDTPLPPRIALDRFGQVPLPPYIERDAEPADRERYQTVYARADGSVAAPTAGLHFTTELLREIEAIGVRIARIVLHVGPGTFRPVASDDPAEHRMHAEPYVIDEAAAGIVNAARGAGGRVWAVGTTVARALESVVRHDGTIQPAAGETALFIRPPYTFRAVDRLITNFHLPRSTLLMLVAAFGGYDAVMRAYRDAVALRYRFYSYGDAMAIL